MESENKTTDQRKVPLAIRISTALLIVEQSMTLLGFILSNLPYQIGIFSDEFYSAVRRVNNGYVLGIPVPMFLVGMGIIEITGAIALRKMKKIGVFISFFSLVITVLSFIHTSGFTISPHLLIVIANILVGLKYWKYLH